MSLRSKASKVRATDGRQLQIVYRSIDELKPNPKNPRRHAAGQIRQIAQSIKNFGFNVPLLVDRELHVIAGHGRLEACKRLGMRQVPTISLEDLTAAQLQAFTIADNRLTELSTWDEKLLGEQFQALAEVELDFRLEDTGFSMGEIDLFIEGLESAAAGKPDPADAIPDETPDKQITQPGDLWLLDEHRVLCGDARRRNDYERLMDTRKATVVFTDPPYNVVIDGYAAGFGRIHHAEFAMAAGEMTAAQFTDFLAAVCAELAQHSAAGALQFICMDWRHMAELLDAGRRAYDEFKHLCVWVKDTGGQGSLYRSRHELVFVFKCRGRHRNNVQLGKFGRYRSNVWQYPRVSSFARATDEGVLAAIHPTVKPVALVADAILDCSARGDIVLDPFLGSGTTVIAAQRTGRTCYGMELEPTYVDAVLRRWQTFTGRDPIHAASGRTFAELAAGGEQ